MMLPAIVLLPLLAALLPMFTRHLGRRWCALLVALPVVAALGLLAQASLPIWEGGMQQWSMAWLPSLGLNLALRLDGLALLFCVLILGIGLLVVVYAHYYLPAKDDGGRFYTLLLLFMFSMLGVVTSDNLLFLVFFWELTSLSSFLLISYKQYDSAARKGARMALTVTGMGGLALLAGVLLIGHVVGSFSLSTVLENGALVQQHALYPVILCLVLLGAFTKSAQFPFHFWLPHAMAAPTPVSADLHCAMMVKAGIFQRHRRQHGGVAGGTDGHSLAAIKDLGQRYQPVAFHLGLPRQTAPVFFANAPAVQNHPIPDRIGRITAFRDDAGKVDTRHHGKTAHNRSFTCNG